MKDFLPWANSVFVEINANEAFDSTKASVCDRWVYRSERRFNVRVFAYLLLSEFGGGGVITKCVSESLLSHIFDDERFSIILKKIDEQKRQNEHGTIDDSMTQQVDRLLKDAFVRVDVDCYDTVTLLDSNTYSSWDDSTSALTGGCSAVLALILEDRLFVANCGHSVAIFGKKVCDEMTDFPLSRTVEMCGCSVPLGTENDCAEAFLDFVRCRPRSCFGDYGHKPYIAATTAALSSVMEAPPTKRWAGVTDTISTAEPSILLQHIELNEGARFLLLVSPQTAKIVQILNAHQNVQPNAMLASQLLQNLEETDHKNIPDSIRRLLKDLMSQFFVSCGPTSDPNLLPSLAMAYIKLEYYDEGGMDGTHMSSNLLRDTMYDIIMVDDMKTSQPTLINDAALKRQTDLQALICSAVVKNSENERFQPYAVNIDTTKDQYESVPDHLMNEGNDISTATCAGGGVNELAPVPSVVDWSEFYTHDLHDIVLAKIEGLKQHYQDRRKLHFVEEATDDC